MSGISEDDWETIALETFGQEGWDPELTGTDIAPGATNGRETWEDLVLPDRMLSSMKELNPQVPNEYLVQARAEIIQPKSQDAMAENFRQHEILVNGYRGISYIDADGVEQNPTIRVVSHHVQDNESLAVRQVTIRSADVERRFDIVLYLNGLPVAIVELKKAGGENADIAAAHAQLQTCLREFPMAFRFAVVSVISDGIVARYGTPFTELNHFSPWNVDEDGKPVVLGQVVDDLHYGTELEFLIEGVFSFERFLQLQRNFTAFDADGKGYAKRMAKPHQYFAVTKAVGSTVAAVETNGKAGVVWHTHFICGSQHPAGIRRLRRYLRFDPSCGRRRDGAGFP